MPMPPPPRLPDGSVTIPMASSPLKPSRAGLHRTIHASLFLAFGGALLTSTACRSPPPPLCPDESRRTDLSAPSSSSEPTVSGAASRPPSSSATAGSLLRAPPEAIDLHRQLQDAMAERFVFRESIVGVAPDAPLRVTWVMERGRGRGRRTVHLQVFLQRYEGFSPDPLDDTHYGRQLTEGTWL